MSKKLKQQQVGDCGVCIAITGRSSVEEEALNYDKGDLLLLLKETSDQQVIKIPTSSDYQSHWIASNGKLSGGIIWSDHIIPTTGLIGCVNLLAEELLKCKQKKYQKMKSVINNTTAFIIPLQNLIILYDKTITRNSSLRFDGFELVIKRLTSSLLAASRSGILTRGNALKKCMKDLKAMQPLFTSFIVQVASVPQGGLSPNNNNKNSNYVSPGPVFGATPVPSPSQTLLSSPEIAVDFDGHHLVNNNNSLELIPPIDDGCLHHNNELPHQTEEETVELGVRHGCWECSRNAAKDCDDPTLRAQLLRVAAEKGCPESMLELGKICENPSEGTPLVREAVCWYREASTRGCPHAKYRLALLKLSIEKETTNLLREVESLLAASASNGVTEAAIHLGWLYESQKIQTKNPARSALRWYKLAALEGSVCGYAHSGYIYLLKGKLREAFKSITIAANNKDPEGMFCLAMLYHYGLGVTKQPDYSKSLLQSAASLGHPEALTQFGNYLYSRGDKSAAFKHYEEASLLGSYEGCCNIELMLSQGYGLNAVTAVSVNGCKERALKLKSLYYRWSKSVVGALLH